MTVHRFRGALLWLMLLALAGCGGRVDQPQLGVYRAELELPGGAAPFGLEIAREQNRYVLYLSNGEERTRVSNVTVANNELTALFPGYESSLRAAMYRKRLEGSVTLIEAGGKEQVIPLRATLGATYRFYDKSLTDNADVSGQWKMTFTNDEGSNSKAVAMLEQKHDRVTGTVMTPTGEHRFLEGQVHGDELQLSTFAGGLAYLYKLHVNDSGGLDGDYWQGLAMHEKVAAHRNDEATLEGDALETTMQGDAKRLDFTFRDVTGRAVSLTEAAVASLSNL